MQQVLKLKLILFVLIVALLSACSVRKIATQSTVNKAVKAVEDSLLGGHLGLLVVEAETGKVLAEHNSRKYFVPASNTKLLTLYAALTYLGDSITGLQYYDAGDTMYAIPTADPTLLAKDFANHPVYNWLVAQKKPVVFDDSRWKAERYGRGWSWSDYQSSYTQERSALPVYGNMMPVQYKSWRGKNDPGTNGMPIVYKEITMGPNGAGKLKLQPEQVNFTPALSNRIRISRHYAANGFDVMYADIDTSFTMQIPYVTYGIKTGLDILRGIPLRDEDSLLLYETQKALTVTALKTIKSQPLDSMLKPMMHRSDNFFAEQTLLMASNQLLGYMSDRDIIDTLLKTHLKDMPDKPSWVDGSGLSRYNLFTPADFVWLLNKMRKEHSLARLQSILPTGNTGTLTNYYKPLNGKLFAKTGTLSGQVALSGLMFAKSGKLLLFSALVNNHNTEATKVRRLVEAYLLEVWAEN